MLIGSTLILTKKGWIPISKLKKNMVIASPKGYYCKIKNIKVRKNYNKKLCYIRKDFFSKNKPYKPMGLTGNHKVFSQKWFSPKNVVQRKYKPDKPITLYHIELKNPSDTLFANGMTVSSLKSQ